ncbi:MAG: CotH kinase family protein [Acholeplasmataceae bacterium]
MIKKIISVFMLFLITLSLASCDPWITIDPNTNNQGDTPEENVDTFERLFDGVVYRKVTIEVSKDNWTALHESLLEHQALFGNLKTDLYVDANMTYEDDLGVIEYDHVGLRTHGNLSLTYLMDGDGNINMNSFKINFRETFDGLHPENDGRRGFELKELDMKWNRNYDETYMTEQYALDMMNHFGVDAAQTTHFILSFIIDGEEVVMGLYTGFEPIDDEFVERRLSQAEEDGDLYKCLWQQYGPASLELMVDPLAIGQRDVSTNYMPAYDLKTNKDTSDHSEFLSFINNLNYLNGSSFDAYIDSHFEVEKFLRLLAVNVFIGNPDDYRAMGNNYFMYQNSESLKWMMIPYDFDHGLGQGWWQADVYPNYSIGVDIYTWFDLNDALTGYDVKHPLVDKILANDTYKDLYTSIVQEILNDTYFTETYFETEFNQLKVAFEGTFDDALDNQGFGLRNALDYISAKRSDVSSQLNG